MYKFAFIPFSYCTNIYMYLLLKLYKVNIKNHPIAKRLYQYRKLLSMFEPIFEAAIKPQIELLLQENASSNEIAEIAKKKTLKVLKKLAKKNTECENFEEATFITKSGTKADSYEEEPPLKKSKLSEEENSESEDSGGVENELSETAENKNGKKKSLYNRFDNNIIV